MISKFWFVFIFLVSPSVALLPRFPLPLSTHPEVVHHTLNPQSVDRIVGGQVAAPGEFPYQASIQRYSSTSGKGSHFCGGSIASATAIISAGHCAAAFPNPGDVRICVGTNHIGAGETCKLRQVKSIILHPDYDHSTVDNDVSVYLLSEPIVLSSTQSAVKLPPPGQKIVDGIIPENWNLTKLGAAAVVSGWGTTSEGGDVSDDLRYVAVPLLTSAACKQAYGESEITDNMICAGVEGKDSCQGDSGGPMVYEGTDTLIGIVSWGYGCARKEYPGVYTKVDNYIPWITSNIN